MSGVGPTSNDETNGHRWRHVFGNPNVPFPRVCNRCLLREDNPLAAEPCDNLGRAEAAS